MSAFFTYGQKSPWGFSPYHDDNPVLDFFEDDAWRGAGTIMGAVLLHVVLFSVLSGTFIMPPLEPEEPEIIPVQIVTFEAPQPEPEVTPEPAVEPTPSPVVPAPVQAPRPKPTPPPPQPEPEPQPVPPPPQPEPEPEPELEPTPPPPPPEILAQPVEEPEPEALPAPELEPLPEPEPLPEQEPLLEPEPVEPILPEIIEPDPEPVIQPVLEPLLDPVVEPLTPPEPLPEPVEPEPEVLLEPEPLLTQEPELDLPPLNAPELVETDLPVPGAIIPESLPEPVQPKELAPLIQPDLETPEPPAPEPLELDPALEPEVIEPDPEPAPDLEPEIIEPDILTAPPTILASPEAPETIIEERRAVPQEQSDPFLDRLARDRPLGPANPADPGDVRAPVANPPGSLGGPNRGGGNIGNPPGGGTQRAVPGTSGWTLAPGSYGNSPGAGYEGLNLDMRCREEFRTHEDCPEYVAKPRGRDAAGFESFDQHRTRGTDPGPQVATTNTARALAGSRGLAGFGSTNVDPGGPSTSLLDDGPEVDFSREFLGNPVRIETDPGRLRDLFSDTEEAEDPFQGLVLPEETNEPESDPSIWPDD